MKYLQGKFKGELSDDSNLWVENGFIHIRSRYWSASDILDLACKSDGENEVFDELFAEWLQERTENKIAEADDILNKFDQKDRFLRLTEAHKAGSVMSFVGAGLSMPSGYPGWSNFLRAQRRQTLIPESQLEELINHGKFEEAAQLIADAQGIAFNEAVDSAFGCSRDLSGAVELLPYVFSGCVATTNFDNVLVRSYTNAEKSFSEKLSGCESDEIRRKLLTEKFLLMLHGTAMSGRNRILTKLEYDAHYRDGNTLKKTIETLCNSKNLLFLGCSLTVDRTLSSIKEFVNETGYDHLPKHYAFLAEPESEEKRIQRQNELANCHIYPLWYPQDAHDESIEALLIKLHEATQ